MSDDINEISRTGENMCKSRPASATYPCLSENNEVIDELPMAGARHIHP